MTAATNAAVERAHDRGRPDVEIVRGLDELAELRSEWIALEGRSGAPDFFQSFAWSMHVAEARAKASPQHYEPLAAVARRGGTVVALWPLARVRRAGLHELRNIDDPFGQLAGTLASDEDAVATLVSRTLELTRERRLAHSVCIERVIEDSALARALLAAGARTRNAVEAPYVDMSAFPAFSDLKLSRNKKSMKNLRNAMNKLERAGRSESICTREPVRLGEIAERGLANREHWLAATGRTAPAFRTPGFAGTLMGPSNWGLAEKRSAFELQLEGASIAQQIGFIHGGSYYAYVSGMDWKHEQLAPGRIHLAMVLEGAMAAGVKRVELLTPASDYKMMWTDTTHRLSDMALALSAAGRARQLLWDEGMRPAVKSAYYAMPAPLRRALASCLRIAYSSAGQVVRPFRD